MAKSISRYLADATSTTGALDGLLSIAAQTNITSLGTLSSLTVSGSAAMTLTTAAQPNITSVGTLSSLTVSGNIGGTLTTVAQPNITSLGTLTNLVVDDITINGSTISDAADLTIDVAGDIILDAAGSDVRFHNAGTLHGRITNDSNGIWFISDISDKDIFIRGNDGGSMVTALAFDMSAAGAATFSAGATFGAGLVITGTTPTLTIGDAGAEDTKIVFDGNAQDFYIGLDDSTDDLVFGKGSALGTTQAMAIDENLNIAFGPFGGGGNAVVAGSSSPSFTNQAGTNLLLKSGDGSGSGSSFMSFYTGPAGSSGTTVNTSVERMRIDNAGNVGIGVTPETWNSNFTTLQIGTWGALSSTTSGNGETTRLQSNFYNDGSAEKYIGSGYSLAYLQRVADGKHRFRVSNASGSADGSISSWIEGMVIDASGNVGINETTPTSYYSKTLQINGSSSTAAIKLTNTSTGNENGRGHDIASDGANLNIVNREVGAIALHTGPVGSPALALNVDTNGHVRMPRQPCAGVFSADQSLPANLTTLVFDTERFDLNSDFDTSTYKFNAPTTGKYLVTVNLYLKAIDNAAAYYQMYIVSDNRTYYTIFDPNLSADADYWDMTWTAIIDMDENDKVYFRMNQSGGSAQTVMDQQSYASFALIA